MIPLPDDLGQRLRRHGQDHILNWWEKLENDQRRELLQQLQSLDLDLLVQLYGQRGQNFSLPSADRIAPLPRPEMTSSEADRKRAEDAFRAGQVAALVVAGGQGSRLGFDQPKGMFPIGPVTNKTLFQIHAEKVLALRRRYQAPVPFLIMTSPATNEETIRFFEAQGYFGLPKEEVSFFCQGTMPALDLETGRLILEKPHRLFLGPNGHGGALTGLAESGLLDRLENAGIRTLFYFQVDNPLVKIGDPIFLGRHLTQDAEVSSKVIPKLAPTDKLGNLVLLEGRCSIIEYSDLPEELARQTDENGLLRMWAGNPAIHIFDLGFLRKVTQGELSMPWHLARKKVPYLDDRGRLMQPDKENALKFEKFIFDALPRAERWTVMPTSREEEFEPVKNAAGTESPQSARQAISNLAAAWLEKAGVQVPRNQQGDAAVPLEISPLFALDAEELAQKIGQTLNIDGPVYLA